MVSLQDRLGTTSTLINTGKWPRAYQSAKDSTIVHSDSAAAWLQLALVCGLLFREEERAAASAQAQQCSDYTPEKEGDDIRDHAILCIRQGNLQQARELIPKARQLHIADINRLGALDMVEGRMLLREGDYKKALGKFAIAYDKMTEPQWRLNVRLHWLFAAILARQSRDEIKAHFDILMRDERNPMRKRAARVALYGGRFCTRRLLRRS